MTANESYQARTKSINAKLSQLRTLLMDHAREQKSEPTNWGCSGDLGYVELQLDSMVDFLAGNDTDPVPV